jgi:hypothetical protein
MRRFMADSGTAIAQFTVYLPYPGTQDYYEMVLDRERRGTPGHVPKRRTELLHDRYWLTRIRPAAVIRHPNLSVAELVAERRKCWDTYYSVREIVRRIRTSMPRHWSWGGKLTYFVASVAFRRIFAGDGISADSVRREKMGLATRTLLKLSLVIYCMAYRWRRLGLAVPLTRRAAVAESGGPDVHGR